MTTPQDILSDGAETYEAKNSDYGDSWRKVGEILHDLADGEPVTLNSPEDHIAYGLLTRRLDKIARAYHGELLADELNFESVLDSHQDESVYAAMSASNQAAREDETEMQGELVDEGIDAAEEEQEVAVGGPVGVNVETEADMPKLKNWRCTFCYKKVRATDEPWDDCSRCGTGSWVRGDRH
jgi:hypothetical protein